MKGKAGAALLLCLAAGAASAYELQPPTVRATGSFADAVAIGDVDGDGRDDVVLTTLYDVDEENDRKVFVYLQRKDGTLADPVKIPYPSASSSGLALADLDHDGAKDIIVGNDWGLTLLKWNKLERLRHERTYVGDTSYAEIRSVAALDVDRDGNLDVAGQTMSGRVTIFFGDGKGGVRDALLLPTPVAGYNDIKSGDMNGDGYADLVALCGQVKMKAYVFYNDGTRDLSQPTVVIPNPEDQVIGGSLAIGDFDGDGRNDLIAMHDRSNLNLFRQSENGTLRTGIVTPMSSYDADAMQGTDMDGDGQIDVVVAHAGGWFGILYQNAGLLQPEVSYPGEYTSSVNTQGLAVGDINGDGCKDAAIANYSYGLVTSLGRGCAQRPDLVPGLGLTKNIVTFRVDNAGNAVANDTHAALMLSVTNGSLALGELPANCSLVTQSTRAAQLDCTYGSMAAAASDTRTLSFQATGGDLRNAVVAKAGVATSSPESETNNNSASKRLMLGF